SGLIRAYRPIRPRGPFAPRPLHRQEKAEIRTALQASRMRTQSNLHTLAVSDNKKRKCLWHFLFLLKNKSFLNFL
ncbi:hypothetical protein, partial [Desulfovibrio sp. 1214_IL3152]